MKNLTAFFVLTASACLAFGQSQRLTLLEEFTQASCGPCAAQNPALNALLNSNTAKVISIKYQTSWPGVDPMNAQTQSEVGPRVTYYGVTGVPNIRYDGNVVTGSPGNLTQTAINNEYAVPSPFTLNVSHSFNTNYDSIFITVDITCTQNTSGTYRARVAMVEEVINFSSPPGTNGETVFYSVMRKMYPNAIGTTLATTWTAGQTQTLTFAAPVPSYIYDLNQIAIAAFIQNDANKNVAQAGWSPPQPLANNSTVTGITGASFVTCAGSFTPTATIKNLGADTMTSCTINMQLDANTPVTQAWTGSLATGQSQTVALPMQTVTPGPHTFKVWTSDPNGVPTPITLTPSHSKTVSVYNASVTVSAPVTEGFEASTMPSGWGVNNPDNGAGWTRVGTAGGFGNSTGSVKMDFYNSPITQIDELLAPPLDLSTVTSAWLNFHVAYAQYSAENDRLQIRVSTNCGATWTTVYNKAGNTLETAPATTSPFTPNATQWRGESVDLSAYVGQSSVLIKFLATSSSGNNMYLDNINLAGPMGVSDAGTNMQPDIYPNPANDQISITFDQAQEGDVSLFVHTMLGELVYTAEQGTLPPGERTLHLNTAGLSEGVYFVTLVMEGRSSTRKIVITR